MADSSGLTPPMLDPSQYPSYLDAQRKQQVAQLLMSAFQNASNSPNPSTGISNNPYAVTPRRSLVQNIAPLVTALMAGRAAKNATTAQQQYYQGLYGGSPSSSAAPPASTGPGAGIVSPDAPDDAQGNAAAVSALPAGAGIAGAKAGGLLVPQSAPSPSQAPPPRNPMIPPGMTPASAQAMLSMMGPETYAKTFLAPQYQTPEIVTQLRSAGIDPNGPQGLQYQRTAIINAQSTDIDKNLRAAGIDPTSPMGQQYKQQLLAKASRDYETVRGDNTVFDKATGKPVYTAPSGGIQTTYDANGNPTQSIIPGSSGAATEAAAARNRGIISTTPLKVGVDENGEDVFKFPNGSYGTRNAGPGAASGAAPATATSSLPTTASAGDIESQKSGAQAGRAFEADLNKQSRGAVEILKSTSELKNLAQQAGGVSVGNDAKARIGALMMAAGVPQETVQKVTGVDAGAIQAAEKQTASLAKASVHEISSRGTNLDLATFLKNNPNLNMNDPAAFARTVDFIEKGANSTIDEHAAFADYKKTQPKAENWETEFNALWNQKQRDLIANGQTNSVRPGAPSPPAAPTTAPAPSYTLEELQAEARKRGLKP